MLVACGSSEPRRESVPDPAPSTRAPTVPTDSSPVARAPDAPAPDATAPDATGRIDQFATREIVGEPTARAIALATRVRSFRLEPRSFGSGVNGADRFNGYRITATGEVADAAFARRFASLITSDQTYSRVDKLVCANTVALGLRFERAGEQVDVLLVFPCNRISFLRRASTDALKFPGEYFDPAAPEMVALMKELFPADVDLEKL